MFLFAAKNIFSGVKFSFELLSKSIKVFDLTFFNDKIFFRIYLEI